ncbi:MAG: sugar ABC transporter substrate-binding protein [Lachnospiraceae bacterium]|jgi:ABC-type sugar transport system substrate-binding protein|nr:sugar ABC transporter substrate-binding protein [Lachnospiraceae bacterium]
MKKRIALLLTLAMVLGLAACGSKTEEPAAAPAAPAEESKEEAPAEESKEEEPAAPAAEGSVKVGFITQSLSNASQAYAWSQFQKYAGDYGFEVTLFDEDYDAQNGVSAIGTCIAQGYTAICMNPTDPSALIPAIMEAKEAGIIIGLYSSELPEGYGTTEYRDFMCGTDDVMCGEVAAQTLMEAFPDGCNVVEVGGQSGHSAQIKRHDGFMNTINDSINVLDAKDCEAWASEDAMAIMEDFIVKYGEDIDAVYCHWDVGATGCIEALKAANMNDVYVIGVDGCSVGYDQVNDGTQALCIGQSFSQMTQDAFDCITTIMNGGTLENDVVWTQLDIVTKDTIGNFPYPEW